MSEEKKTDRNYDVKLDRRRRAVEGTATFGLLLVCVALIVPFAGTSVEWLMAAAKWIYASGALIYTVARVVGARDPRDSAPVKRMRRMEFWGGVAFIIGAVCWFVQDERLGALGGILAVLKDTIMFTLVGAAIQLIGSWLIVSRIRKEANHK